MEVEVSPDLMTIPIDLDEGDNLLEEMGLHFLMPDDTESTEVNMPLLPASDQVGFFWLHSLFIF